jgi:hypothetical protein
MNFSVIRVETEHYGWVKSLHRSPETADNARAKVVATIRRRNRNAMLETTYIVSAVTGKVGERVRYA